MSAGQRSGRGPVGRLLARVGTDRLLGAVALVGTLGAALSLLAATGVVPLVGTDDAPGWVVYGVPLVGVVLVLVAVTALFRAGGEAGESLDESAVSTAESAGVGESFAADLGEARANRYAGRTTEESEAIHELLVDAVSERLQTRAGLGERDAERAIAAGTWTDDSVAAGFLSPGPGLPRVEALRGVVDPGRAYRRRVDRTLDAIDRIGDGRVDDTGTDTRGESDGSDGPGTDPERADERPPTEVVFDGALPEGKQERQSTAWAGLLTVLLFGVGVAAARPILVVGATLGLWYVAASVVASRPGGSVRVTRHVSMTDGDPGDIVCVETTVRNTGEEPLVDLRVVDGVPEALPVRSGSPRACVSLGPGETARLRYELELRRGEFDFDPVALRTSDLTGLVTARSTVGGGGQTLRCLTTVRQVPLSDAADGYAGTVPTDEAGQGVEFYSVREYEPGDPVGDIDWRQYAHTRDLATVEYRTEQTTRAVCVVDCRESQQEASAGGRLPARDISIAAARRASDALLETGHPTGLVALESRHMYAIEPSTSADTRAAIHELLDVTLEDEIPGLGCVRSVVGSPAVLPRTLSGEAQVFLFTSLVDDAPVDLAAQLCSRGFAVTIVSPDVTAGGEGTAWRLAELERERRLRRARRGGARVFDWEADRPLARVLETAMQGVGQA